MVVTPVSLSWFLFSPNFRQTPKSQTRFCHGKGNQNGWCYAQHYEHDQAQAEEQPPLYGCPHYFFITTFIDGIVVN